MNQRNCSLSLILDHLYHHGNLSIKNMSSVHVCGRNKCVKSVEFIYPAPTHTLTPHLTSQKHFGVQFDKYQAPSSVNSGSTFQQTIELTVSLPTLYADVRMGGLLHVLLSSPSYINVIASTPLLSQLGLIASDININRWPPTHIFKSW